MVTISYGRSIILSPQEAADTFALAIGPEAKNKYPRASLEIARVLTVMEDADLALEVANANTNDLALAAPHGVKACFTGTTGIDTLFWVVSSATIPEGLGCTQAPTNRLREEEIRRLVQHGSLTVLVSCARSQVQAPQTRSRELVLHRRQQVQVPRVRSQE